VVEIEHLAPTEPTAEPPHYAIPVDVGGWLNMLTALREQLQDDRSPLTREHWKHRHLYDALVRDMAALGKAHPGGLNALSNPRPRR
jgi:hypothetical protein